MSRRHVLFACEGDTLVGTLDEAPGETGLMLVSGGNEVRAGAFAGQAQLAARIAAAGHPVFRFDRRGVGDSSGENLGFRGSEPDIAAALAAFRAQSPGLARVVGFGNCDAASALMLAAGAGCDALVLANPWTIEHDDGTPPPAAIRARYAEKLRDPNFVAREVQEAKPGPASVGPEDITRDTRQFTTLVRADIFSILRGLISRNFEAALENLDDPNDESGLPWTAPRLERAIIEYLREHERLLLDNEARNVRHTYIKRPEDGKLWRASQTMVDPDGHNDWSLELEIDLAKSRELGKPHLRLLRVGPIQR